MSFSATITFTVNAVAKVLNKIRTDNYSAEYYLKDGSTGEYRAFVRHSQIPAKGLVPAADVHVVEFVHKIWATASTPVVTRRQYFSSTAPTLDDATQVQYEMKAFTTVSNGDTLQGDLLAWLT